MSAAENELSGYIDREESINEDNGNGEVQDESNVFGSDQDNVGEPESQASTEETGITSETSSGVGNRILEAQEKAAAESSRGIKAKPKKEVLFTKLSDQLTRHFQLSKESSDKTRNTLQQIQRQLKQIDKIAESGTKQQAVIKQLEIHLKVVQKQVDRMNQALNRLTGTKRNKGKGIVKKRRKSKNK
jgi:hypothetical protein